MTQRIFAFAALAVLGGGVWVGIDMVRARHETERYRQRLADLSDDYRQLRQSYNQAITRTAVTELLVDEDSVQIVVRTAEGELKRISTPFDPQSEIYVDYVVLCNRLWIRRVFDDATSPKDAVLVNPLLDDVDWDSEQALHGKAIYRRLGPGRWIITVTGDGSLGLARAEENTPADLVPPPQIYEFAPLKP